MSRLEPVLTSRIGPRGVGRFAAHLIAGGNSNLTYLLQWGDRRLVLRRPPPADGDPRAHDVQREFRLLRAFHPTPVPVPEPIFSCDDTSVMGAPFYVMAHVEGRVLCEAANAPDMHQPVRLERLADALVEGLVAIHRIHPESVGLGDLGRADGYVERQVNRWVGQWDRTRPRPIPALDEIGRRLVRALATGSVEPNPRRPYVVHGDFNLGNVIVAQSDEFDDPEPLRAVLDWEMATLGHPLMDLAILLAYSGPHADAIRETTRSVVSLPGFPDTTSLAARYGRLMECDLSGLRFFEVLAHFKLLVLNETIRAGYLAGERQEPRLGLIGWRGPALAEAVLAMADDSGITGLAP